MTLLASAQAAAVAHMKLLGFSHALVLCSCLALHHVQLQRITFSVWKVRGAVMAQPGCVRADLRYACVQSKMPKSSKTAVDEDDTDIERRALLRRRQAAKVRARAGVYSQLDWRPGASSCYIVTFWSGLVPLPQQHR